MNKKQSSDVIVNKKQSPDVIVIGAGAGGLMAAVSAARQGARVQVLERMPKGGKKLLITGNGRCNLTTLDPDYTKKYHSCEKTALSEVTQGVFSGSPVSDTLEFFEDMGLLTCARGNYVYPHSMQAKSVLDVLLGSASQMGVTFRYNTPVKNISRMKNGKMKVEVEGYAYEADRVILCGGSKAAPDTGSDGSAYALAERCGHSIVPVLPALTPLISSDARIKAAAGARTFADITLLTDGEAVMSETGEVQWTKDGISGIAVFNLSGAAARAIDAGKKTAVKIDLVPGLTGSELRAFLQQQMITQKRSFEQVVRTMINDRAAEYVLQRYERGAGQRAMGTDPLACKPEDPSPWLLCSALKSLEIPICGVKDFSAAQTCSGGVSLSEVDPETLGSRCCPGLYLAGEVLDIDGPCGGYNLQWAWSSGYVAGKAAGNLK